MSGDEQRLIRFEEKAYPEFTEDPEIMLAMHKDPDELSLLELRAGYRNNSQRGKSGSECLPDSLFLSAGCAAQLSCRGRHSDAFICAVCALLLRFSPMVAISKCIAYFAAFYLLVSFSNILGERELLSAWMAVDPCPISLCCWCLSGFSGSHYNVRQMDIRELVERFFPASSPVASLTKKDRRES